MQTEEPIMYWFAVTTMKNPNEAKGWIELCLCLKRGEHYDTAFQIGVKILAFSHTSDLVKFLIHCKRKSRKLLYHSLFFQRHFIRACSFCFLKSLRNPKDRMKIIVIFWPCFKPFCTCFLVGYMFIKFFKFLLSNNPWIIFWSRNEQLEFIWKVSCWMQATEHRIWNDCIENWQAYLCHVKENIFISFSKIKNIRPYRFNFLRNNKLLLELKLFNNSLQQHLPFKDNCMFSLASICVLKQVTQAPVSFFDLITCWLFLSVRYSMTAVSSS